MLVEVVSGNMSVLLEEVGRGEEGGEEGEMGERRGGGEEEAGQLALDVVEQLLVRDCSMLPCF